MTTDNSYNGYKNYETWCVTLWLENDEATYTYWREEARRHVADAPHASQVKNGYWTEQQAAKFLLADQLKSEFIDNHPFGMADVYSDLLDAALDAVDWHEVADQFLADFLREKDETLPILRPLQSSEERIAIDLGGARFSPGELLMTPGVADADPPTEISSSVSRHLRGDWGSVNTDDWKANDQALVEGTRLLSSYETSAEVRIWIITEADRSATTVLLPSEY